MRGGVQVREKKRGNEGEYGLASGCTCSRDVDGGTCEVWAPHCRGERGNERGDEKEHGLRSSRTRNSNVDGGMCGETVGCVVGVLVRGVGGCCMGNRNTRDTSRGDTCVHEGVSVLPQGS